MTKKSARSLVFGIVFLVIIAAGAWFAQHWVQTHPKAPPAPTAEEIEQQKQTFFDSSLEAARQKMQLPHAIDAHATLTGIAGDYKAHTITYSVEVRDLAMVDVPAAKAELHKAELSMCKSYTNDALKGVTYHWIHHYAANNVTVETTLSETDCAAQPQVQLQPQPQPAAQHQPQPNADKSI